MTAHKILNIYIEQTLVGHYEQHEGKNFFSYAASYLQGNDAKAISISLPLRLGRFDQRTTHNFFAGMLPEEQQRIIIAKNLGVTAGNDYSLLEKIGGECAGAISLLPAGIAPEQGVPEYKKLTNKNLLDIIVELPKRPLLAGADEIRMSLAGVQDKFAIAILDGNFFLPLNGAPTTHIIKPEISGYDFSTVTNEAFCLKLAKSIGLSVADCEIGVSKGIKYLLVERYDREVLDVKEFKIKRFHQEDFCQALNIAPEYKYQNEGGPGLEQCVLLVRNVVKNQVQGLKNILDAIIYNYIVGNCDAHGKNFSLLYKENEIILAPIYDVLCTEMYSHLSHKMAMKIGDEYNIKKISSSDFMDFSEKVGLNKKLVLTRLIDMANMVLSTLNTVSVEDADIICNFIGDRASKIINDAI